MRLSYHSETDSLYIHPGDRLGEDVVEISEAVAVDVDASGVPIGIDVASNASEIVDLSKLEAEGPIFGLARAESPEEHERQAG